MANGALAFHACRLYQSTSGKEDSYDIQLFDLIVRQARLIAVFLQANLEVKAKRNLEDGDVETSHNGEDITANENANGSLDVETNCGKDGEAAAAEVTEDLATVHR